MLERVLARLVVLLAALALCASAASAQVGSTTDLVIGRVLGPDTLPLKHARVSVTSVQSGITRTTSTNDEGRYTVVFPDGGGRYVVTAQYLGMFPARTMVQRQADEDRLVADFRLQESPVVLEAIRILATQLGDTALASAGANGKVVTRELLDRLGYLNDDATAIAMITPGVNLIPGSDTSLSAISIGGQSSRQTKVAVDGVAGGASLPGGAVKSTTVMTSEYDVSHGGFTGGFFNQETISGTNRLLAHLNTFTPLAPIGPSPGDGVLLRRQTGGNVGADVSGPLRRDHLFFAAAGSMMRMSTPAATAYSLDPAALTRLGVAPDSLTRFLDILASHGLAAPSDVGLGQSQFTNQSGFARLDFTPNEHNTLTLSGNSSMYLSRGFTNPLSTAVSSGEFVTHGSRAFLALTSHAGAWVNDARVSANWTRSGIQAGTPAASGSVVVPSTAVSNATTPAIQTFGFGGFMAGTSITYSTAVEARDEVSRLSADGAHRVKAGLDVTLTHSTGGVPSNIYGNYRFNSLADLEAGTPASYTRTLAPADRRSGVADAAAYVGDAWRLGPQLQLVYGARLDQATFRDAPVLNPAALTEFGLRTDHFPRNVGVSPRFGFTYLPGARQGKAPIATVRGGIGIFRSSGSNVAETFAAARDATGLADATAHLSCVGAAVPAVDWDAFVSPSAPAPETCSGMASTGPAVPPSVTFIDPSFDVPRTFRASLSVAHTFHKSWNVTVDASLTNGASQVGMRDINLVAAPRFTIANEDGRPVYADPASIVPATGAVPLAASRLDPEFGLVALASSTLRNRDRTAGVSISHNAKKLSINASYTHAWSRQQVYALMPGVGGIFFGGPPAATAGDPRVAQWVQSPFSPPHSVRVFASYSPTSWMQITPSLYARNTFRFEPRVAGDVNGDGAYNDLAFVFDPAHTTDTAVANGMRRLLASAPRSARECLTSQLGRLASSGSCSAPWFVNMALSVQFTPSWQQKRLTLSVQTTNVVSGADMLLHGPEHLHGWGQFFGTDQNLLYVRGFDPTTRQFRYAVNERFGVERPNQTYAINPFQLMLSARINLGAVGGPMMMGGPPGAKPGAVGGGMNADTLRARLARTVPNPFRRTIALKDSLALGLDSAQLAQLKAHGDAFQPHADSIVAKLATIMSAPLTGPGAADVATRVRTETDAAKALETQAVADLRTILTDAQLAKLPASVTKPTTPAAAPRSPLGPQPPAARPPAPKMP